LTRKGRALEPAKGELPRGKVGEVRVAVVHKLPFRLAVEPVGRAITPHPTLAHPENHV
jgi:hypothetical protein